MATKSETIVEKNIPLYPSFTTEFGELREPTVRYCIYYSDRRYTLNVHHESLNTSKEGWKSRSTTLFTDGGSIGLIDVDRKSKKIEKELTEWFNEHILDFHRVYVYGNDDNMYALHKFVIENKSASMYPERYTYRREFKSLACENPGYFAITDAWDKFNMCGDDKEKIQYVFNNLLENYKSDYKRLSELEVVCNWKCWQFAAKYEKSNKDEHQEIGILYQQFYERCYRVFCSLYNGDEAASDYHFQMTD